MTTTLEAEFEEASKQDRKARRAPLQAHALPLAEDWSVWRTVALRSAGFPASGALDLATEALAGPTEQLLAAEEDLAQVQALGKNEVNAALDQLRAEGAWDDRGRRRAILKSLKLIAKGRYQEVESIVGAAVVAAYGRCRETWQEAVGAYREAYQEEVELQRRKLSKVAGDPAFKEAVLWQNPTAYFTGIAKIAGVEEPRKRNSQERQKEELVASYLQRYSVKNDTIGFFGPVAWAELSDEPESRIRIGERLLSRRQVFIEAWALESFGQRLASAVGVAQWLAPRALSAVRLEGTRVQAGAGRVRDLDPVSARLLAAAAGKRSARELAVELVADPEARVQARSEVYRKLADLRSQGLLQWGFQVPGSPEAATVLRRQLAGLGDPALAAACIKALDHLEEGRERIAAAAGDPESLGDALQAANEAFTRLSGASSTRAAGGHYAGRTVYYEDCLRDISLHLGRDLRAQIGPALGLVMASARWLTARAAEAFGLRFEEAYGDLVAAQGSKEVPALDFHRKVAPLFSGSDTHLQDQLRRDLQNRWREILQVRAGEMRRRYRVEDLAAKVEAAFPALAPGWEQARIHNPDLMLEAADLESVERGLARVVLGEVHVAMNTLNSWVFMALYPDREGFRHTMEADRRGTVVLPLSPRGTPTRICTAQTADSDYVLLPLDGLEGGHDGQALDVGDLVVVPGPAGLRLRTRDGKTEVDLLEAYGDSLARLLPFRLLPEVEHWPRVEVDRLVLWRESWNVCEGELDFVALKEPRDRFLAVQRLRRRRGMPRRVFVKAPLEDKPLFLDFDAPIFVDLLVKVARRAVEAGGKDAQLSVSEMLPGPEGLWLQDVEGRRYTSEFRFLVSDLRESSP